MKKLFLLLLLIISISAKSQLWTNSLSWGNSFKRLAVTEGDTTTTKLAGALSVKDGILYIANGVKWNMVGGGVIDTLLLSTRAWRQKGIDSVVALLNNVTVDSFIYSTRAWRQKGIDSVNANVNARVKYTDTALMLTPYLRTANYSPVDTTALSNRINLKLNISDSSSMLSPYIRNAGYGLTKSSQTLLADSLVLSTRAWRQKGIDSIQANLTTGLATKLNISDTATMLSPYSKLKSVGLTMPSAFSVANSPLTSNGTLAVTGAGTSSQYVRGDGQLANFPSNGGGGSSVNYYLNGSINQGTFGGNIYYQMSKTPVLGAGTNFTRTNGQGNGYIASFITDAGDPSLLNIPAGNWNLEFYFASSASGGNPEFYGEIYKVSATNVFTLVASGSANPEGITNGTTVDQYYTAISVPQTTLLVTDRLAIRIYVITGGRTITLHTENSNLCEVLTTFSTGLNALNGLTAQVQYLATGTGGSDFNISSATNTHTFNIPTASTTNTGKLSNTDFTAFQQYKAGDISRAYQILGSTAKAMVLGNSVTNMSVSVTMTSQQIRFMPIYIPFTMTLTGVTWYQATAGNYTANNYNGVGLYSYSGGTTLTYLTQSTDDGNIWKATSGSWNSKAFSSTYVVTEGMYYVAVMYSSSAQTTAPAIGGIAAPLGGSGNVYPVNFTSGVKLFGTMNTQLYLPYPTQNMSNAAFTSTAVTTPFVMVY
jgi:hypothetical protein